jgi:arsenate reductase-like glutaredoxin family protein
MTPREVLSTRSRAFQTRRDEIDGLSDRELVGEMVAEPRLLRRPILVGDGAHLIGAKNAELQQFVEEIRR